MTLKMDALAKSLAEQSENDRLRTAICELAAAIRGWECKHEFGVGMVYEGKVTQDVVQELEALANPGTGMLVRLPDDWLSTDYTASDVERMRRRGEARAAKEEKRLIDAILEPDHVQR